MTMDENVAKAVERMCTSLDESVLKGETAKEDARCMALIRARLVELEAENERLRGEIQRQYECIHSHAVITRNAEARAEKADALLRRSLPLINNRSKTWMDITAHLSENEHG
jgi:hypothetical protein